MQKGEHFVKACLDPLAQGTSPDSGASLSSREASPGGVLEEEEEEESEGSEEESEEGSEECSEEGESGEETGEGSASEEESTEEEVVTEGEKKNPNKTPFFLLRKLVTTLKNIFNSTI